MHYTKARHGFKEGLIEGDKWVLEAPWSKESDWGTNADKTLTEDSYRKYITNWIIVGYDTSTQSHSRCEGT